MAGIYLILLFDPAPHSSLNEVPVSFGLFSCPWSTEGRGRIRSFVNSSQTNCCSENEMADQELESCPRDAFKIRKGLNLHHLLRQIVLLYPKFQEGHISNKRFQITKTCFWTSFLWKEFKYLLTFMCAMYQFQNNN